MQLSRHFSPYRECQHTEGECPEHTDAEVIEDHDDDSDGSFLHGCVLNGSAAMRYRSRSDGPHLPPVM